MGRLKFVIDLINKTVTLDWSLVSETQLYWVGRSQGYQIQVPDPENPGAFIDNPIPIVPWVLNKRLAELTHSTYEQYLRETPDPRAPDAEIIADFQPLINQAPK